MFMPLRLVTFIAMVLAASIGIANAQNSLPISQWPIPSSGSVNLTAGDKVVATRNGISYGLTAGFGGTCAANNWVSSISAQGVPFCTPPSFNVALGTSAVAPNPFGSSSDTTTGLFTLGNGKIDFTSAGTVVAEFNPYGLKLPGNFSPGRLIGDYNVSACGYTFTPTWCSGSDFGAWYNSALTAIGTTAWGTIVTDGSNYTYSTTMGATPDNVSVDFNGSLLTYRGTSGAAFISAEPTWSASTTFSINEISNLRLAANGGYTSGNTNIGIFAGGDPAGVITPSTYWSPNTTYRNIDISGFYKAYTYGNNTWKNTFYNAKFHNNYDGVYIGSTATTNSGELFQVYGSNIYDNNHCGVNANAYQHWGFSGTSFDYNGTGVCGTEIVGFFNNVHFEQNSAPMVNLTSASVFSVNQSTVYIGSTAAIGSGIFNVTGSGHIYNQVYLHDISIGGNYSPPYVVYTGGVGDTVQKIDGVQANGTGYAGMALTDATVNGAVYPNAGAINVLGSVAITSSGIAIGTSSGYAGSLSPTNGLSVQGSVGIGTNLPVYPLDVVNTTSASDLKVRIYNQVTGHAAFLQTLAGNNYSQYISDGTGVEWFAGQQGSTNFSIGDNTDSVVPFVLVKGAPTYSFVVQSSGNVGVGGASPQSPLSVNGGVSIGTSYFGTAAPTNGVSVQGQALFGTTTATGYPVSVNSASTNQIYITSTGSNGAGILINNVAGGQGSSIGYDDAGTNTFSQGIQAASGGHVYYVYDVANNKNPILVNSTTGTSTFGEATNQLVLLSGGNVGIGTATPASLLGVYGGGLAVGTYAATTTAGTGNGIFSGTIGIGTATTASKLDVNGGITVGASYVGATAAPTNGIVIQGQVAIGTTAPNGSNNDLTLNCCLGIGLGSTAPVTTLTVGGATTSGQLVSIGAGAAGAQTYIGINNGRAFFGYDSTLGDATIQGVGGKGIEFNVNNSTFGSGTAAVITSGGLMGIGTITPDATLDVYGGHFLTRGGSAPSISSCGSGASVSGSDASFNLTMGSTATTSCVVNFGATWSLAPAVCTLQPTNATAAATGTTGAYVSAISTTQLTVTGLALASATYGVHCH